MLLLLLQLRLMALCSRPQRQGTTAIRGMHAVVFAFIHFSIHSFIH